jgi:translation initiation factor RLI1
MSDPNTDTISTPGSATSSLSSSPYLSASSASGESVESAESIFPPATPPNLHQNTVDPNAGWVIQKFGGTSVGKYARRIGDEVVKYVVLFNYAKNINLFVYCVVEIISTLTK